MKITARKLRPGDTIRSSPPLRIDAVEREGLRVIVRSGERVLRYLASESVGVTRLAPHVPLAQESSAFIGDLCAEVGDATSIPKRKDGHYGDIRGDESTARCETWGLLRKS